MHIATVCIPYFFIGLFMNQTKEAVVEQVVYQGRWINKSPFRSFVYSKDSAKVAESWDEYQRLLDSGVWFATLEEAKAPQVIKRTRKVVEPVILAEPGVSTNAESDSNAVHH
jgi:hypothetical protein